MEPRCVWWWWGDGSFTRSLSAITDLAYETKPTSTSKRAKSNHPPSANAQAHISKLILITSRQYHTEKGAFEFGTQGKGGLHSLMTPFAIRGGEGGNTVTKGPFVPGKVGVRTHTHTHKHTNTQTHTERPP